MSRRYTCITYKYIGGIMFDRYWHCFVAIALRIIVTSAEDADEPGYNNHTDPGNGGHVNATTGTAVPSSYGCDIENPWYHTPVTCIKLVSTLCAFLTLVTYTCVLKQLNRINYVKHYAACLTVSMGLNLLEDAMFRHADHRRPFTFVHKTFGNTCITQYFIPYIPRSRYLPSSTRFDIRNKRCGVDYNNTVAMKL